MNASEPQLVTEEAVVVAGTVAGGSKFKIQWYMSMYKMETFYYVLHTLKRI